MTKKRTISGNIYIRCLEINLPPPSSSVAKGTTPKGASVTKGWALNNDNLSLGRLNEGAPIYNEKEQY